MITTFIMTITKSRKEISITKLVAGPLDGLHCHLTFAMELVPVNPVVLVMLFSVRIRNAISVLVDLQCQSRSSPGVMRVS